MQSEQYLYGWIGLLHNGIRADFDPRVGVYSV